MKVIIIKDNESYDKIPTLYENDFGFTVNFRVKDDLNASYDIGSTSEVLLKVLNLNDEAVLINNTCEIVSSSLGQCRYEFKEADLLNTSGIFTCELEMSSSIRRYSISMGRTLIKESQ